MQMTLLSLFMSFQLNNVKWDLLYVHGLVRKSVNSILSMALLWCSRVNT